MAVPKRKMSRSRTRHRKAQWLKTSAPTTTICPRCKSHVRPHTACATCGTYKGVQVLDVE
ncbi:50S ribosomal protein L32 [Salsipaludibacter albus]|jgi:large subunit ribosomal protein L32|uniref:50S ribosomal protein L32 n=1 Tax=Salsipaludibacter albus TaxID=2849650 RepID=UPI001EE453EB|nr:50S ribosomal protein L32 [Salsipaludibacter albus]MBY5162397.1 50S ribosomal protein L32 [Salsipaludibacter albus]